MNRQETDRFTQDAAAKTGKSGAEVSARATPGPPPWTRLTGARHRAPGDVESLHVRAGLVRADP
jgi:hypothetical protein